MERHELKRLICDSGLPLQEILDKILQDLETQNRIWVVAWHHGMAVVRGKNKSEVADIVRHLIVYPQYIIEVEPDAVNIPVQNIKHPHILLAKEWHRGS